MSPFPWSDAMAFGLGTLRLSPRDFWSMTPRELQAAMRGVLGMDTLETAPTRAELDGLLARFPDGW